LGLESVGDIVAMPEGTTQLRDIGEASFGAPDALPETVHGADGRFRITATGAYPWRAHASLRITAADDSLWIGTGWFVGPRILVTAGHVVYIKNSGVLGRDGWVKRITVMPGRNGSTQPYGSTNSSRFWTVVGWSSNGDQEYDYGAIVLSESLGNRTGWFGFGNWSNLNGVGGNISGYPGDKPAGTQWYEGRTIDSATARKVYYDIDTAGGQSGSAVYRFHNGGRYGIAIHAYGGATVNSGTRINGAVFSNIKSWKDAS
jgi:glutamyl endopeptidase